jgi:hypothetical protein
MPDDLEFRSWYKKHADKLGLAPDPDDPLHYYDWRGAYIFKLEGHPNLVINGVDTRTGNPVSPQPQVSAPDLLMQLIDLWKQRQGGY